MKRETRERMESRKDQHGITTEQRGPNPSLMRWTARAQTADGRVVTGEGWTEAAAVHAVVSRLNATA